MSANICIHELKFNACEHGFAIVNVDQMLPSRDSDEYGRVQLVTLICADCDAHRHLFNRPGEFGPWKLDAHKCDRKPYRKNV